jgi:SPP1 family predicted phage head-tail adaptor
MRAGQMDRRVTLRRLARGVQRPAGDYPETYVEYATVWARKIEVSGREFFQAQTKDAETTVRFEVRWRDDVESTDRVTCEGLDYQLIAPPSEIGRREGLTLFARAVSNG